jgi:hypothetical protein
MVTKTAQNRLYARLERHISHSVITHRAKAKGSRISSSDNGQAFCITGNFIPGCIWRKMAIEGLYGALR